MSLMKKAELCAPTASVLAIDPGIKALAWAGSLGGRLMDCAIVRRPKIPVFTTPSPGLLAQHAAATIPGSFTHGVAEQMVVYPPKSVAERNRMPAQANDLILLTAATAIVLGMRVRGEIAYLTPHTWKGNRPKEVTMMQVLRELDEDEKLKLAQERYPESLRHNLFDAVGLLLKHLGRIA
jgi:hypothetical protein